MEHELEQQDADPTAPKITTRSSRNPIQIREGL